MPNKFKNFKKEDIDNFYRIISKNIKKHREEKKMSQLELALEIDIKSVAFYSNCENNKQGKHFNLEHLYKIAYVLDCKITDFFEGIEEK